MDNQKFNRGSGQKEIYSYTTSANRKKQLEDKGMTHLSQNILEIKQIPVKQEEHTEEPQVRYMRQKKVKEFERYVILITLQTKHQLLSCGPTHLN